MCMIMALYTSDAQGPVARFNNTSERDARRGSSAVDDELVSRSASILGIGTSVPPFVHEQSTYPDYYFDETNCNYKTELKAKFKRLCDKLQIHKRHLVVTRELLNEYPSLASHMDSSLTDRHKIVMEWVPKLAIEAAAAAIKDWGGPPAQAITHMVMATTSVANIPGVDTLVAKALGLSPKVQRVMLTLTGCWGGAAALRVAKDMAENNPASRVLVVCSECSAIFFRAPHEDDFTALLGQALFADGAGAAIVGVADPNDPSASQLERSVFEIKWSGATLVPGTEGAIDGHLEDAGMVYYHSTQITQPLTAALADLIAADATAHVGGVSKAWNDLFWAVHPSSAAMLEQVQQCFGLAPEKLRASREVLWSFGNMESATVFFVLDGMRRRAAKVKSATTGEGHRYGFLVGTGPGLSIECLVLKAAPLDY